MIAASATVIALCLVSPADHVTTESHHQRVSDGRRAARSEARAHAAALKEAADARARQKANQKAEQRRTRKVSPTPRPAAPPAVQPSGSPKAYARSLVGAAQFGCLDALWTRESGWRHTATNPSSEAYGIPQSLPGSKMASAGADWRTNPRTQIKWGVGYIKGRYGTPCAAWAHSEAVGWY